MIFRALKAIFRRVFFGRDISKKEYENRLSVCNDCLFKRRSLHGDRCGVCKCILKMKARWSTESCPKDKWKKDE